MQIEAEYDSDLSEDQAERRTQAVESRLMRAGIRPNRVRTSQTRSLPSKRSNARKSQTSGGTVTISTIQEIQLVGTIQVCVYGRGGGGHRCKCKSLTRSYPHAVPTDVFERGLTAPADAPHPSRSGRPLTPQHGYHLHVVFSTLHTPLIQAAVLRSRASALRLRVEGHTDSSPSWGQTNEEVAEH